MTYVLQVMLGTFSYFIRVCPDKSSQYRRSWNWRETGSIGREYLNLLKNPIWDLKWAAVLGGRRYWKGQLYIKVESLKVTQSFLAQQ